MTMKKVECKGVGDNDGFFEFNMGSESIDTPGSATADINKGVWFQSNHTGLWYEDYRSAGTIYKIRVDGVDYFNIT